MILARVEGEEREATAATIQAIGDRLMATPGTGEILGPAPCPLERLRGKYRFMLILKGESASALRQRLRKALAGLRLARATKLVLDADPVTML
jgi:primosomal protein N' (replication factor Y)